MGRKGKPRGEDKQKTFKEGLGKTYNYLGENVANLQRMDEREDALTVIAVGMTLTRPGAMQKESVARPVSIICAEP